MKSEEFFARKAEIVAKDLVGCYLVREREGEVSRFQITETEAYLGEEDEASHARFGKTGRSEFMYGPAGVIYAYLIYGMYDMLNIVTGSEGEPQAVLIRGIEGADGPGKLTKKLSITKDAHNGHLLGEETGVWVEGRPADFDPDNIKLTSRTGIDYASKEWKEKRLRFFIEEKHLKKS